MQVSAAQHRGGAAGHGGVPSPLVGWLVGLWTDGPMDQMDDPMNGPMNQMETKVRSFVRSFFRSLVYPLDLWFIRST